jgi:hypothetical protein
MNLNQSLLLYRTVMDPQYLSFVDLTSELKNNQPDQTICHNSEEGSTCVFIVHS